MTLLVTAFKIALLVAGLAAPAADSPPYLQIFADQFKLGDPAVPADFEQALAAPLPHQVRDAQGRLWEATAQGLVETDAEGRRKLWTGADGLPILDLKAIALGGPPADACLPLTFDLRPFARLRAGPSTRSPTQEFGMSSPSLWLATRRGAILFEPDTPAAQRWYYFAGRRYLGDDDILGLAPSPRGAWVRTRAGVARIEFRPYTLETKAAYFERRIVLRHRRHGFIDECEMPAPGDLAHCRPVWSDNDGLWTAIYVAAECFRYGATGSSEALANARSSLRALLRLESVTGIPGFPARAIAGPGEPRDRGGEWHHASDGSYWKGDTSSDELVGNFFADWVAWNLLPERDPLRARAAAEAGRIAHRLVDHGLRLVGPGGRVTRWGNYTPEYFRTPEGREDEGLDSLEILSHLRVAARLTADPSLAAAYRRVGLDLGYLDNVQLLLRPPAPINYSDEELAVLAFFPLLAPLPRGGQGAETDPALRARFRQALAGFALRTAGEHNPLWEEVFASSGAGNSSEAEGWRRMALDALERIPLDTFSWTVRNSGRADLLLRPRADRFGRPESTRALPANERPLMKWNGNPFSLDGGDGGRSEDDGAFFLLPYWMGRYYGRRESEVRSQKSGVRRRKNSPLPCLNWERQEAAGQFQSANSANGKVQSIGRL